MDINLDASYVCNLEVEKSEIKHVGQIVIENDTAFFHNFVFFVAVDDEGVQVGAGKCYLAKEYIDEINGHEDKSTSLHDYYYSNDSVKFTNEKNIVTFDKGDVVPSWLAKQKPYRSFYSYGSMTFRQGCSIDKETKRVYVFDMKDEVIDFKGGVNINIILNQDYIDADKTNEENFYSMSEFKKHYLEVED